MEPWRACKPLPQFVSVSDVTGTSAELHESKFVAPVPSLSFSHATEIKF